ncbi:MAG: ribosomal protein S18-alanine N-acetyltransferase [Candidatus Promineifilaceae bacterium]
MLTPPAPYVLRPMRLVDVPVVMRIERLAFAVPWSANAYEYELSFNKLAHYQVLGLKSGRLIGYAGYWMLAGEAHISTIAIRPAWRGRGLGELLLLNLLYLALADAAALATLEVRLSNTVAQALYAKYRFEPVGRRKRYYQNREDALLMTAKPLDVAYRAFLDAQRQALFGRVRQAGSAPVEAEEPGRRRPGVTK